MSTVADNAFVADDPLSNGHQLHDGANSFEPSQLVTDGEVVEAAFYCVQEPTLGAEDGSGAGDKTDDSLVTASSDDTLAAETSVEVLNVGKLVDDMGPEAPALHASDFDKENTILIHDSQPLANGHHKSLFVEESEQLATLTIVPRDKPASLAELVQEDAIEISGTVISEIPKDELPITDGAGTEIPFVNVATIVVEASKASLDYGEPPIAASTGPDTSLSDFVTTSINGVGSTTNAEPFCQDETPISHPSTEISPTADMLEEVVVFPAVEAEEISTMAAEPESVIVEDACDLIDAEASITQVEAPSVGEEPAVTETVVIASIDSVAEAAPEAESGITPTTLQAAPIQPILREVVMEESPACEPGSEPAVILEPTPKATESEPVEDTAATAEPVTEVGESDLTEETVPVSEAVATIVPAEISGAGTEAEEFAAEVDVCITAEKEGDSESPQGAVDAEDEPAAPTEPEVEVFVPEVISAPAEAATGPNVPSAESEEAAIAPTTASEVPVEAAEAESVDTHNSITVDSEPVTIPGPEPIATAETDPVAAAAGREPTAVESEAPAAIGAELTEPAVESIVVETVQIDVEPPSSNVSFIEDPEVDFTYTDDTQTILAEETPVFEEPVSNVTDVESEVQVEDSSVEEIVEVIPIDVVTPIGEPASVEEIPAEEVVAIEEVVGAEEFPVEEPAAVEETVLVEDTTAVEETLPAEEVVPVDVAIGEPAVAEETLLVEDITVVEETVPAEEVVPVNVATEEPAAVEENLLVEEPTAVQEAIPGEEVVPVDVATGELAVVEETLLVEETTAVQEAIPVQETIPAEGVVSVDVATGDHAAVEETAVIEETTAVEEAIPAEEVAPVDVATGEPAPVGEVPPVEVVAVEEYAPIEEITLVEDITPVESAAPIESSSPVEEPVVDEAEPTVEELAAPIDDDPLLEETMPSVYAADVEAPLPTVEVSLLGEPAASFEEPLVAPEEAFAKTPAPAVEETSPAGDASTVEETSAPLVEVPVEEDNPAIEEHSALAAVDVPELGIVEEHTSVAVEDISGRKHEPVAIEETPADAVEPVSVDDRIPPTINETPLPAEVPSDTDGPALEVTSATEENFVPEEESVTTIVSDETISEVAVVASVEEDVLAVQEPLESLDVEVPEPGMHEEAAAPTRDHESVAVEDTPVSDDQPVTVEDTPASEGRSVSVNDQFPPTNEILPIAEVSSAADEPTLDDSPSTEEPFTPEDQLTTASTVEVQPTAGEVAVAPEEITSKAEESIPAFEVAPTTPADPVLDDSSSPEEITIVAEESTVGSDASVTELPVAVDEPAPAVSEVLVVVEVVLEEVHATPERTEDASCSEETKDELENSPHAEAPVCLPGQPFVEESLPTAPIVDEFALEPAEEPEILEELHVVTSQVLVNGGHFEVDKDSEPPIAHVETSSEIEETEAVEQPETTAVKEVTEQQEIVTSSALSVASDIERPKSPWSPSYSVMTQGPGVAVEERVDAYEDDDDVAPAQSQTPEIIIDEVAAVVPEIAADMEASGQSQIEVLHLAEEQV
ncbi:uncharacterized protein F5147DRAFT_214467 [Suillus discolor]|uniref:Uncharacterized protein n=1 Tax=Suillus discolor TaxID=1912936 RepID=A0A9P7F5I2_9AGAM|nr:uncharacterized protein F5147DRAFT_214467 [Suillus discolor]KAG2107309.1 hypothetical protein F5147DRAFT_214467 [Suillus discolor]